MWDGGIDGGYPEAKPLTAISREEPLNAEGAEKNGGVRREEFNSKGCSDRRLLSACNDRRNQTGDGELWGLNVHAEAEFS